MHCFCEAPARSGDQLNCTVDEAFENAKRFAFIGLTSEMTLTLKGLARVLPQFFAKGANSSEATERRMNASPNHNKRTHTTMKGAISDASKAILKARWLGYAEEVDFYERVVRLFWCRTAALGLLV